MLVSRSASHEMGPAWLAGGGRGEKNTHTRHYSRSSFYSRLCPSSHVGITSRFISLLFNIIFVLGRSWADLTHTLEDINEEETKAAKASTLHLNTGEEIEPRPKHLTNVSCQYLDND